MTLFLEVEMGSGAAWSDDGILAPWVAAGTNRPIRDRQRHLIC